MPFKPKEKKTFKSQYAFIEFRHKKNAGAVTVSNYADPKTKQAIYLKDSQGNVIERTIRPPKQRLDLNIPDEKLFYEFMRMHDFTKGANSILILTNKNEKAKEENVKIEATMAVNARIASLTEDALLDFGLILGYSLKEGDHELVKNKIYKYVAVNPSEALTKLNDPDYNLRLVVHKALEDGSDLKNENGIFKYGEGVIGTDIEKVILWLKDNPIVREALKNKFEFELVS